MRDKSIKTWLGLPHAFIRRLIVVSVIGFPFVGSSISPMLIRKPAAEPACKTIAIKSKVDSKVQEPRNSAPTQECESH